MHANRNRTVGLTDVTNRPRSTDDRAFVSSSNGASLVPLLGPRQGKPSIPLSPTDLDDDDEFGLGIAEVLSCYTTSEEDQDKAYTDKGPNTQSWEELMIRPHGLPLATITERSSTSSLRVSSSHKKRKDANFSLRQTHSEPDLLTTSFDQPSHSGQVSEAHNSKSIVDRLIEPKSNLLYDLPEMRSTWPDHRSVEKLDALEELRRISESNGISRRRQAKSKCRPVSSPLKGIAQRLFSAAQTIKPPRYGLVTCSKEKSPITVTQRLLPPEHACEVVKLKTRSSRSSLSRLKEIEEGKDSESNDDDNDEVSKLSQELSDVLQRTRDELSNPVGLSQPIPVDAAQNPLCTDASICQTEHIDENVAIEPSKQRRAGCDYSNDGPNTFQPSTEASLIDYFGHQFLEYQPDEGLLRDENASITPFPSEVYRDEVCEGTIIRNRSPVRWPSPLRPRKPSQSDLEIPGKSLQPEFVHSSGFKLFPDPVKAHLPFPKEQLTDYKTCFIPQSDCGTYSFNTRLRDAVIGRRDPLNLVDKRVKMYCPHGRPMHRADEFIALAKRPTKFRPWHTELYNCQIFQQPCWRCSITDVCRKTSQILSGGCIPLRFKHSKHYEPYEPSHHRLSTIQEEEEQSASPELTRSLQSDSSIELTSQKDEISQNVQPNVNEEASRSNRNRGRVSSSDGRIARDNGCSILGRGLHCAYGRYTLDEDTRPLNSRPASEEKVAKYDRTKGRAAVLRPISPQDPSCRPPRGVKVLRRSDQRSSIE